MATDFFMFLAHLKSSSEKFITQCQLGVGIGTENRIAIYCDM